MEEVLLQDGNEGSLTRFSPASVMPADLQPAFSVLPPLPWLGLPAVTRGKASLPRKPPKTHPDHPKHDQSYMIGVTCT